MTLLRLCLAWLFIPVLTSHAQPGGFDSILADPTAQVGAGSKEVTATLVAAQTSLVPGKPLDIALKLEHPDHWHTYWLNPGIGVPTSIKWDLPAGWSTTPLIWPVPKVVPSELGNQHIYEGTTWLFATVTPPADLAVGTNFTLKGAAKWLVCDEASSCNPGGASLTLSLPVAAAAEPVAAVAAELKKVQAVQAVSVPAWQVKLDPKWNLTLTGDADLNPDPGTVYFFDHTKNITTDPQTYTREGNVLKASLKPADEESNDPPAGFLYAPKGWKKDGSVPALLVGAAPAGGPGTPTAPSTTPSAASPEAGSGVSAPGAAPLAGDAPKIGFMVALASLFLAGMILNLMPCVFPVLALKVLSFARQAGKDPKETRKHSLAYTMGLLVFVWLVAGGMFVAKSAFGLEFAWGDLTRYTGPMAVVVIVLFLLGLNLAGLFEIGTSLSTVGGDLQDKKGYAGSFWSGALTMLISTPCSGPFMAVAMGYALQQSALSQFLLFTSFGLGIAFPYVLLSSSPALLKKLPRPGAWMETFKKALAFPMFAAAIYFFNTFAAKTGETGSSLLLWSLLFVALAAWIYGHWCVPSKATRTRFIGGLTALIVTSGSAWFAVGASREKASSTSAPGALYMTGNLGWTKWSPEVLAAERAKGRAVFVNYTTVGCITCDTNELRVFKSPGSDAVAAIFKELNVAPLRAKYYADSTPADDAIRDSLKPWGISTFPAYVMYPANPAEPPFLVSDELLSQSQVLEALARATKPAGS
jgi:thiol:disulfide interchange protein/DsbC/DsbD-like thiol-disulfide interchange protein